VTIEVNSPKKHDKEKRAFFEGMVMSKDHFEIFEKQFKETVHQFAHALDKHPPMKLPTELDDLKAFLELGRNKEARATEAARDVEIGAALAKLTQKLKDLEKAGLAPKGVILNFSGIDGAGKTSTGGIVMKAFKDAGWGSSITSFKARTLEEKN